MSLSADLMSLLCKRHISYFRRQKLSKFSASLMLPPGNIYPKTLIEMWIIYLDPVSPDSEKGRDSEWAVSSLSFNISWKSENRVSKSKIEFQALASI